MLRIAVCDDDRSDRERVHGLVGLYLKEKDIRADVRQFDHPDALIEECKAFRPHIYILDIVMPMLSGIEAARELRWDQPDAQIIFATSETSYALESFDVNPINYIVKPIEKEKLFQTLDLAIGRVDPEKERYINLRTRDGMVSVPVDDILYVEYGNHVVSYHTFLHDTIKLPTIRIGFSEYLENNHPHDKIIRCHESIAVNINAIIKLSKNDITLSNNEHIPVSKSRYSSVLERYMDHRL